MINNSKKKILILGASGMAGNMIEKILSTDKNFHIGVTVKGNTAPFVGEGCDVYRFDVLKDDPFFAKNYEYIINCIGAIPNGNYTPEEMVRINTVFPIELAKNCKNSKIIHLTTDAVFDKKVISPQNDEIQGDFSRDYYIMSKHLGEVIAPNVLNLRCSIIGPELNSSKSFFEKFLKEDSPTGWSNHEWNGITTYHLAQIIKGIISNDLFIGSTQHIVPNGVVNKYQMMMILNEFNWGKPKKEVGEGKAPVPTNRKLSTVNTINNSLFWMAAGYASPPNFTTMIIELHRACYSLGYIKEKKVIFGEGEY